MAEKLIDDHDLQAKEMSSRLALEGEGPLEFDADTLGHLRSLGLRSVNVTET